MLMLLSAAFFQSYLFQKNLSGTLSERQTVWIQIRNDVLSVLIWVQTVCIGYQRATKVVANKAPYRFNFNYLPATYNRLLKNFKEKFGPK